MGISYSIQVDTLQIYSIFKRFWCDGPENKKKNQINTGWIHKPKEYDHTQGIVYGIKIILVDFESSCLLKSTILGPGI